MHLLESPNVAIHVVTGVIGLVVGLLPLTLEKGSLGHRRWGKYFEVFAGFVVATAIWGVGFGDPPTALVAVTLTSSYQYVGSLRSLSLRTSGPNLLDAGLALVVLALVYTVWKGAATSTDSWPPALAYSTFGYLIFVALYDLSRHFWSDVWLRSVRPLDHGLKMVGVYFGMLSAGSGNLMIEFQPWSQLLPNLIGSMVVAFFVYSYTRSMRRKQSIPEAP